MSDDAVLQLAGNGFGGELIAPSDVRYDAARQVWNGMVDRRPRVITKCSGADDVVAALGAARGHGLPVAVRGGGHNVAGNAVCDGGLVIDLSGLKGIHVDPATRTARVQPGVLLGEFDRATQAFGLATPTGNVSMTGLAGLTLGGGLGWIARKLGPACDNLLAAELVTADGERVTASADENARPALGTPWRRWELRRRDLVCVPAPSAGPAGHRGRRRARLRRRPRSVPLPRRVRG